MGQRATNSDEDAQLLRLLAEANACTRQAMDQAVRPHGITATQYGILHRLADQPGLTGADMARMLFVSPQSAHLALTTLEKKGLIERRPHEGTRRPVPSVLTAEGRQVVDTCRAALEDVASNLTGTLAPEERRALISSLGRYARGPAVEERPRPYDSPVRRSQAEGTRERIIEAAAELARGLPSWDWGSLTIQAVAGDAGVSRRTVYRHFESEAALHAALARRLQDDAGVSYEGLTLDRLPDVTARVFASVATFAVSTWAVLPSPFPALDADRLDGLRAAIAEHVPGWHGADRERVAAALDVVWSVASYELLLRDWKLDPDEAVHVLRWLHDLAVEALGRSTGPGRHGPGPQGDRP